LEAGAVRRHRLLEMRVRLLRALPRQLRLVDVADAAGVEADGAAIPGCNRGSIRCG
jgi:hypothetical protein